MSAIAVREVVKRFTYVALPKQTTLKETLVRRLLGRSMERRHIEAIGGVSFEVQPGEMLGIIGRNGSGKTTLMRLLAGIYAPDGGEISINGKVAPLLAVGAGFHPDLTGRENARIELMILGFSPRQIDDRMQEIIDFAEIEEFIDSPVRTYSTGMMLRLAFSAAVSVDPDVLLLDEVLSVGDQAFAEKCMARIEDFRNRNKTIVLVTHSVDVVRKQCDVAMWLEEGKIAALGDPVEVTNAYDRAARKIEAVREGVKIQPMQQKTLLVYGNCQAEALFNLMQKDALISSLFRVLYYPSFEAPGGTRVPLSPDDLSRCALLFSQHDPDSFPYTDQLPRNCLTVRFPSVDFNLLWPFNCINPYNKPELPQFPWGRFPYGDRVILECVKSGMAAGDILDYYLTGWQQYEPNLKRLAHLEEGRLTSRDGHCEVKMAPWVFERFRRERLFWTVNHPTQMLLCEVLQGLFRAAASLEPALQNADIAQTSRIYFPAGEQLNIANIPIHPALAEELQLEWYEPSQTFKVFGEIYSYEEYFRQMIEYCARAAAPSASASA